jgi:nucleoside-diphosphate-sugar epimerase
MVVGKTRAVMVTEETPCSPVDRYQRTKLEIERLLVGRATTDLEVVIVRPTAVFGPGGENLLKLAREIAAGEHRRPVGYLRAAFQGRRRMNVIPVGNAVAALAFLGTRAGRHDQRLFILAEDDHPANNYADVAAVLASGLGARPFRLPVVLAPSWALRAALRTLGRAQAEPCRRFDCGRLLRAGFRRPCDFVQELRFFAEWFRAEVGQAPRQGVV